MSTTRTLFRHLRALGTAVDRLIRHAIVWLIQALVLTGVVGLFTRDATPTLQEAFIIIVIIAMLNTAVLPVLIRLAVRVSAWLFPVITFGLNAGVLILADLLVPGWRVNGVLEAGVLSVILTAVSGFFGTLLSISDDGAWQRFALGPVRARYQRGEPLPDQSPGFAFLEIDGLSEPILREAMARGYAPHLAELLRAGTHTLDRWECDLSSQTSASQAGILLGNNRNVPAFRWYDKALGRVMVSNSVRDAGVLQTQLTTGSGLLVEQGASRGNLFSGDAPDSLFTMATILYPAQANTGTYFLFYANPYNVARTLALFVADVVRELVAATWQLLRNERPRVRRFGVYPLVRAATTSLLRELSTFTVAGDLLRGVPAIYTTYVAYDEVAHHSGVARGDAMRVLRDIDRDIGRLARVAAEARRPYHLVVLSDHGQSQGATFRQRYGATLSDVVQRAIAGERVREHLGTDEGWQSVSALVTDVLRHDFRASPRVQRAVRRRIRDGEVVLPPNRAPRMRPPQDVTPDGGVIVLASGNLGLISFAQWDHRLTLEEIEAAYPVLVPALAQHPGIGFLMIRSGEHGPVVIGGDGIRVLEDDRVIGKDPLAGFEAHAADHLRRADGFDNAPDIYVNSMVDGERGEVAAFEELVGSHGGLGGFQTEPFILHPVSLALPGPRVAGAEMLHHALKGWIAAGQASAPVTRRRERSRA